jgi:YHS domain-containing protein
MIRDPVCGMQIKEVDAYAARDVGAVHVALCSAACATQFDAAPQRYLQQPDHPSPARPHHRISVPNRQLSFLSASGNCCAASRGSAGCIWATPDRPDSVYCMVAIA